MIANGTIRNHCPGVPNGTRGVITYILNLLSGLPVSYLYIYLGSVVLLPDSGVPIGRPYSLDIQSACRIVLHMLSWVWSPVRKTDEFLAACNPTLDLDDLVFQKALHAVVWNKGSNVKHFPHRRIIPRRVSGLMR